MLMAIRSPLPRFIEFGEEEGQEGDQIEAQRYIKDPDNPGWLWDVEAENGSLRVNIDYSVPTIMCKQSFSLRRT